MTAVPEPQPQIERDLESERATDVRYSYLPEQFADIDEILDDFRNFVPTGDFTLGAPLAEFERRFKASYGRPPPRVASLAYDATALAAVLGRQSETPDFSAEVLTDPSGFGGSGGIFRFHADGLNSRGLAILEVTPTGVRVIDPAPASFAGSGF